MSRILKRPMFRKGGSVDEGIVSLGRKKYADGPGPALDPNDPLIQDAQRREALLRQYAGPAGDSKQDLYDMLIQGGLNLVSGTGAGKGTLGAVAESFKKPTAQFLQKRPGEEAFQRQLKLSAATGALGAEGARKELESKEKIAKMALEAQTGNLAKTIAEEERGRGKDPSLAGNIGKYVADIKPEMDKKYGSTQVGGRIEQDITNPKQRKKFISKNKSKKDKYFYDAVYDRIVQLVINTKTGELDFIEVDQTGTADIKQTPKTIPTSKKKIKQGTTKEQFEKQQREAQEKFNKLFTEPKKPQDYLLNNQPVRTGRG